MLSFGILVAATLMAATPIYTRVMNDLGLQDALQQEIASATRNGLNRFGLPLGQPEAATESLRMAGLLSDRIGWLTASEVRSATLSRMTLATPGQPTPAGQFRPFVSIQTTSGYEDRVRVVEGRLPEATNDPTRIEAVISVEAATAFQARVGDRLAATQDLDDCNREPPSPDPLEAQARARFPCVPRIFLTLDVPFTIVGLIEANDRRDPFWSAGSFTFERPRQPEDEGPTLLVLVPERTFFEALPRVVRGLEYQFNLTSFADVTRLNSANLQRARDDLSLLRDQAQSSGLVPDLALQNPLQEFNQRASFNQVTLLLLLLQVVGIAIYYVLLVSSLLAERRAEEIAMLRSRGATVMQIVTMSAAEALVLALLAAVAAPFIAAGVVAALGKTGTFDEISGGRFLTFQLLPEAFLYALAGAILAAVAVVIPSFLTARQGIVLFLRGASRPGRPFMQRYYLDFALAGLAALAFWELNQRGSVFDPESIGGWSADPLLLFSPLLLILAVGSLLFRFLPLALGIVTRLLSATAGPGAALGLWQLTRSPARYTQLALLVVMAASVGTFAATYGATTDRSQDERALFQAGADLRTTGLGDLARANASQVRESLVQVPGVEEAVAAFRGQAPLGPITAQNDQVTVLGIDPSLASSMLWFRDDFAGEPLEPLTRRLLGSPAGGSGLVLQGEPVALALWAGLSAPRNSTTMWLRTVDARGVYRLHELGTLDFTGYQYFRTPVNAEREGVQFPLSILGVLLTQSSNIADPSRANLYIDDISAIDSAGAETVVEDFEGPFRWTAVRTATRNRDTATLTNQNARRGTGAAQLALLIGSSVQVRGLLVGDPNVPLPAIASRKLLERTGVQPGGELELIAGTIAVPLSIQAVVDLFPSLPDDDTGFVIVNQEHLYAYTQLLNQNSYRGPNEAWLRLPSDPGARDEAKRELEAATGILGAQMIDVQQAMEDTNADPIVKAGGSGVLLIALVAAFAILALGFVLTLYLGGRARTVEVSVLRAVGLSPRQVLAMISLEYLLVAAAGLAIGTMAGLRISATMLSFLNVTEDGGRVVPPFALVTNWDTIGLAFIATAVAFVIGVLLLAAYFLRLPVSRVLRLTR